MTLSGEVLELIRRNSGKVWTASILRYEAQKRGIYIEKEYAKKLLQRLAKKGVLVRSARGKYIFSPQRDILSHLKGQKGTKSRGMSHLKKTAIEQGNSSNKCDKGTCHVSEEGPSLYRRMIAVLTNQKFRKILVSPRDFTLGPYLKGIGTPETKRRYFYRLEKMGILKKVRRGRYRVDVDLALKIIEEGTPLRVHNMTNTHFPSEGDTSLITVSHHFRVKKAIPLKEEEFERISKYLWSRDPMKDYINGVYLEATPTSDRDRSHGVKIKTHGAVFHVTYSYKKGIAKVMIYPSKGDSWTYAAEGLFGNEFVKRAVRIGISSHFAMNLDEIKNVIFEGDEIKVTVNRSDFGASGDVEFEGVSKEGAELARGLIERKLSDAGEIVDQYEVLKRRLDEIYMKVHTAFAGKDNVDELAKRLDELEHDVKEIKDHVMQHTRYLNLKLAAEYVHDFSQNSSSTEGYA